MKKIILGATVLFIVLVSVSLFGQEKGGLGKVGPVGFALKGSMPFGPFKPITGTDPFESAGKIRQNFVPGVEVSFNPGGRFSPSIEFLGGLKTESRLYPQEFYDLTVSGKTKGAILGNVYINTTTRGRVRPYFVVGGGVEFTETLYNSTNVHLPEGIAPAWDLNNEIASKVYVLKAGAGVSIFVGRHITIMPEGGFRNRGYASISVRFQ